MFIVAFRDYLPNVPRNLSLRYRNALIVHMFLVDRLSKYCTRMCLGELAKETLTNDNDVGNIQRASILCG